MDGDQPPDPRDKVVVSPRIGFRPRLSTVRSFFRARLRTYFFAGILVTAPIAITLWLGWQIIEFFDRQVRALIPARYSMGSEFPFTIPGIGLAIFIVAMIVIGMLTANLLGRRIVLLGEAILTHMPVVRSIYGATKQIFESVLAQKSDAFRQVVLVEFPRAGMWSLGFVSGVTGGEIQDITDDEVVNVFVPTTPNPTSGYLMFVPRREVVELTMTVEEGIKMVVSGGIVTPPDRRPKPVRPVENAAIDVPP